MPDIKPAIPYDPDPPSRAAAERPRRYLFVLLDRFTMLSFAAAMEPLRLANRLSGRRLYEWQVIGEQGEDAACSNGARVRLDGPLADTRRDDTILVCGGVDVTRAATRPVLAWLRREERRGTRIGALCTGAWVLAEAGLLDGRRATIHWENQDGFAERFPDVTLIRTVFIEDGNRLTAAGGTAAIDMMLRQIARDHGTELANRIADQMIHTSIRSEEDHQRLSIPTRIGARHPRLAQVVARMEANIEEPVSPARLASEAGMSPRQLERLFARYLGRSPKRYYMEIRLERARNLLMQTEMSVMEIALACGFASAAHFSKCYRATYGSTPYRQRGTEAEPGS
ncbi:transcriptional regulator, AraC family with amidase-like domain [Paracoccus halophilus]|uniref:AraC family transcriptional regulator n=1 Tax=Paracoccus halophilus TaxID=376733 RepID=A0A099F6L8_9RHOB|nr:GlxA family transcriptional regulator [Paracoccus halophilus]KGJ06084.1 AraC family transcriptional regulator [Paracoccus halophilus]SFA46365.1 transcriptional regulator, AraC family with amidase-like domain [Paracoccus halophilus]